MTSTALIICREDFERRGFLDWLVSHISLSLPPHRYRGIIEITDSYIKFTGTDTRENTDVEFFILKNTILEVYLGYDEAFNIFKTRGLGLFWAPVRLKIQEDNKREKYIYCIIGYNYFRTANREFYEFLKEWLA